MKTDLTPMPIDAVPRDPSRRTAPVRVLYLMEGFEAGGAERRFVRMARGLDSNRFALTIAALRLGGPLEAEMRVSGVPVVPFERRSRFDITPALRLRRFLRAERIQVVHAMHWLSNLIATLAASTLPRVAVVGSTVGMVYTPRGGAATAWRWTARSPGDDSTE